MGELSAREHALRLTMIGAVKKFVTDLEAEAKAEAKDAFRPGDRLTSTTDDGTVVGTVSMTKQGEGAWAVVDEQAFLAWVRENRPTAIVESVRSSDQTSILGAIETTGLIPDGVDFRPGSKPYLQVRPDHKVIQTLDWRRYLESATSAPALEAADVTVATPVAEPDLVEEPPAPVEEPNRDCGVYSSGWGSNRIDHDHRCHLDVHDETVRHSCTCGASWLSTGAVAHEAEG